MSAQESALGADGPPVVLCLLGLPRVLHAGSGQWRPLPRKAAALLARVVVDGAASREAMATELWPEQDGDKPRVNLRGLLRDLRALCGRDLLVGARSLTLAPDVAHDLQPAATGASAVLLGALAYADLDDFNDWLLQARHRRHAVRLQHLRDQLAQLEAAGSEPAALAAAERLLADDATDEAAWRSLMRLLYRRGDTAAARAAYARCRQQLQQALQAEPAPATRALALLIETGEPLPTRAVKPPGFAAFQPRRLVGRESELLAIDRAWTQGQPVLLDGESGIGKTRLLLQLASTTGAVRVAARDGDADQPYALLVRLLGAMLEHARPLLPASVREELARLRPEFGAPPDRPARARRLAEALADALAQWQRSGVRAVLLDDVQHADSASLQILLQLMVPLSGTPDEVAPMHWLLAQRGQAAHPVLAPALDKAGSWCRLSLQPLSVEAVAELLRHTDAAPFNSDAWATALAAPTGGNPLLLIESLQALQASGVLRQAVPPASLWLEAPSLPALLAARMAELQGLELQLAQLAAVAGGLFSASMATQVLGCSPLALGATWHALEVAGVLQGAALRHDSLRSPLLARLPAPLALSLHASVAEHAQAAGADAGEVARHWLAARAWAPAAQCLQRAAERAFKLNARRDEMGLWQQAADAHARLGHDAAAFDARLRAFDAALEVLPWAEADAWAQTLQRDAQDPLQHFGADMALARASITGFRHDEGVQHAQRAIDSTVPFAVGDPRPLRAIMLWCAGMAASGRQAEALQRLDGQRQALLDSTDVRLQLDHHSTRGYVCNWAGRWGSSIDSYARALDLAETLDDAAEAATIAANLAVSLARQGDCGLAYQHARQSLLWRGRMAEADGMASAMSQQVLAVICLRLTRCDEALAALQQAMQAMGEQAPLRMRLSCEVALANTWVELGQPVLARAALTTHLDWPHDAVRLPHALAMAAIEAAEGHDALPALQAAREKGAKEPDVNRWSADLRMAALGESEQALVLCRSVADQAAAAGAWSAQQAAWLHEARALLRLGDRAGAVARLQPALLRAGKCCPLDMGQGEQWLIAAQVLHEGGCAAERDSELRRASTWLNEHALPHVPLPYRNSFLQRPTLQRLQALLALQAP